MRTTRSRQSTRWLGVVLAVSFGAASCGGGSGIDEHSPSAVAACLNDAGVSAAAGPAPAHEAGDWNIFGIIGTVTARRGAAIVTIEVTSDGDNFAYYRPDTPPVELADAVAACTGSPVTMP